MGVQTRIEMGIYIDVEDFPDNGFGMCQLIFLLAVYGYILFVGSNLVGDGAELLLLVPSISGVVGSIVLPVLGAVPDGAIVLFSGLGSGAQDKLNIGVGALAGSTVMLLTMPWFLAIMAGRVDLGKDGKPQYKRPAGVARGEWRKCSVEGSCSGLRSAAVSLMPDAKTGAKYMLVSSLSVLIIQVPAFAYQDDDVDSDDAVIKQKAADDEADNESPYVLATLIVCFLIFFVYLVMQYRGGMKASKDEFKDRVTIKHIQMGDVSLRGALADELLRCSEQLTEDEGTAIEWTSQMGNPSGNEANASEINLQQKHAGGSPSKWKCPERLKEVVRSFFLKYDVNKDGMLDREETQLAFRDMDENMGASQLSELFDEFDADGNGSITFDEFCHGCAKFIQSGRLWKGSGKTAAPPSPSSTVIDSKNAIDQESGQDMGANEESDGEDDPEIPEDFVALSPEEQQTQIKKRAAWQLLTGTALLLLFSDPTSDALDSLGKRIHISGFYVSFVLAPFASNASELIAAYHFAQAKTQKSIEASLAGLCGAGVMNNTFVTGIFMVLVYSQSLYWDFGAEVVAMLVVEWTVGLMVLCKQQHTMLDAWIILSLYPLCLLIVALLEEVAGLK